VEDEGAGEEGGGGAWWGEVEGGEGGGVANGWEGPCQRLGSEAIPATGTFGFLIHHSINLLIGI